MQAMPMVNQPAPVNEAVAPRAARSTGKATDDKFLPALKEACNECGDEELAGAAMVTQDDTPQQALGEGVGESSQQPVGNGNGLVVVTEVVNAEAVEEAIVAPSASVDADEDGSNAKDDGVNPKANTGESAPHVGIATTAKGSTADSENLHVLNRDVAEQRQFAQGAQVRGAQQSDAAQAPAVEALGEPNQAGVGAATVPSGEVQTGVAAQVVAAVSEGNQGQKLNIPPLKKATDTVVKIEKMETVSTTDSRPVVTDPRFATLLNKPEVGATLRQQQGADSSIATQATPVAASVTPDMAVEKPSTVIGGNEVTLAPTAETLVNAEVLGASTTLVQKTDNAATTAVPPQVIAGDGVAPQGSEISIPLRDGSSVPESRVVQQTIDHLALHARGDSSSITVKLHPEELGELQLRMVMEGDQLKVHLQAQTQQVQEVLERNFPRLRDALQDQGVTVEDFQVSVDSGERGDQQSSAQQDFVANKQADHLSAFDHDVDPEVEAVISAAAAQSDGRGVSLRV